MASETDSSHRANASLLHAAIALAVGGLAISLPWLGAMTDVRLLADATTMLMLPGMLPGMVFGARDGGGIHDISFPAVLAGTWVFYSLATYLWLRWRSKR